MAIPAPTTIWTKAEDAVVNALPHLGAFRDFCGAADADAAAAYAFIDEVRKPENGEVYTTKELQALGRHAVISSMSQNGFKITRHGATGDCFLPSGVLSIDLERLVPEADEHREATKEANTKRIDREFKNSVGAILESLPDYLDLNSGPWLRSGEITDGPWHTHPDSRAENGHWVGCSIELMWGRQR